MLHKNLSEELIMSWSKLIRSYLYCNQYENIEHLFQCSLHSYNPQNTLTNEISNALNTLNLTETSPNEIIQILTTQNFPFNSNIYNTILLLIQGTITLDQYKQLQLILKKLTNNFLISLSNSLLIWFNSTIWQTRNTKQHDWETLRGITAFTKRKNNNRLPNSQLSNHNNTTFTFNTDIGLFIFKTLSQNFTIYNCFY